MLKVLNVGITHEAEFSYVSLSLNKNDDDRKLVLKSLNEIPKILNTPPSFVDRSRPKVMPLEEPMILCQSGETNWSRLFPKNVSWHKSLNIIVPAIN